MHKMTHIILIEQMGAGSNTHLSMLVVRVSDITSIVIPSVGSSMIERHTLMGAANDRCSIH